MAGAGCQPCAAPPAPSPARPGPATRHLPAPAGSAPRLPGGPWVLRRIRLLPHLSRSKVLARPEDAETSQGPWQQLVPGVVVRGRMRRGVGLCGARKREAVAPPHGFSISPRLLWAPGSTWRCRGQGGNCLPAPVTSFSYHTSTVPCSSQNTAPRFFPQPAFGPGGARMGKGATLGLTMSHGVSELGSGVHTHRGNPPIRSRFPAPSACGGCHQPRPPRGLPWGLAGPKKPKLPAQDSPARGCFGRRVSTSRLLPLLPQHSLGCA